MNQEYFVLFIHGNPGSTNDFKNIATSITGKQVECLNYQRPAGMTDESAISSYLKQQLELRKHKTRIIVAYSWGCYFSVQMLQQIGIQVDKLIFIAPTLNVEKPVSRSLYLLAKTPVLNRLMLKSLSPRQTHKFIHKLFIPGKPTHLERRELTLDLENWQIWRDAIIFKYRQQHHAINIQDGEICNKLILIYGEIDQTTIQGIRNMPLQQLIAQHKKPHSYCLPNGGHALLWTHTLDIINVISIELCRPKQLSRTPERPGYFQGKTDRNNIINLIRRHVEITPDHPALAWCNNPHINGDTDELGIEQISYQEFYRGIERLALGLRQTGIQEGDRVILFLPMGLPMYTAMFAIMWLGATSVFLDSWARRNQLGASALCVAPKAMISHRAAFELVAAVPEFKRLPLRIIAGDPGSVQHDAHLEELMQTPVYAPLPLTPVYPEYSALITFTTGSSDTPKGADRSHRFLSAQHYALNQQIPYFHDDIDIPVFPIFSLNNLASGITSFLPALDLAEPKDSDSSVLATQIRFGKVSCATLSVGMMNNLADYCQQHTLTLSGLRRVITGGAPVSKDNVRNFLNIAPNTEVHILYGSTEVEPIAHITDREMLAIADDDDPELIEEGVNVGKIAAGLEVKLIKPVKGPVVLDDQGWTPWLVDADGVGELIVSGDHVCERYFNNNQAFVNSKIRDKAGIIWHRTGDLVRFGANKYLYVVGRVHNMIQRDQQYLFPVKAEILLKRCSFVKRAAYLGLPDTILGEKTGIAVEFKPSAAQSHDQINEILRLFKKNNMPVDSMYQVEHLPMDPRHHSKVEYGCLRELILSKQAQVLL